MDISLTLTGIVVFVTHSLEAITGFGCTALAFPFVTALEGIYEAKIMLAVMAWLIAFYIVTTKYRHINFRHFFIIASLTGIGMPVGVYLFNHFPSETLKLLLGIFIVVTSLMMLKKEYFKSDNQRVLPAYVYYIILLAGGIIHGAFATGGPFVILYATRYLKDKGQFRVTLSLLWFSLNSILFMTDATFQPFMNSIQGVIFQGAEMTKILLDTIWMIPFLGIGIVVGELVHNKVNASVFRKIVFWVLLGTGIFIVIAHFMN